MWRRGATRSRAPHFHGALAKTARPPLAGPGATSQAAGAVVAHALRRDTDAVICRLRFRPPAAG